MAVCGCGITSVPKRADARDGSKQFLELFAEVIIHDTMNDRVDGTA